MALRVGIVAALIAVLMLSSIGIAAADYHTADDYDDDDWDGDNDWDGDDSTDSNDDTDSGYDINPSSTFTGVALPIPDVIRAEHATAISEAKSSYPGEPPELWLFMNQETTAIVASETPIQMGDVEVEGYQSDAGSISVIVAESVTLNGSPAVVDSDGLSNSPNQYEFQYVKSTAPVKHVPFAYETGGGNVMQETTTGAFDSQTLTADFGRLLPPTELANHVTVNASRILNGGARGFELGEYRVSGRLMLDSHEHDTWVVNSDATVTGVVLNRPVGAPASAATDDLHWLYADSVEANADSQQEFDGVVERSETESRFTVSTEVNLVGSSISTKESLVAASACDGSETVGAAPNCVPAVTDMTVVTGVAVADGDEYQALPFIAATNDIQSNIVEQVQGRFRVTGEVRDLQDVHPGFNGRALVLYEMERLGGVRLDGDVASVAERDKTIIVEGIREQMQVHPSEYESYTESQDRQNPISTSSNSGPDSETEDEGNGGIGDVTADGNGFSMMMGILGLLFSILVIRRRNR